MNASPTELREHAATIVLAFQNADAVKSQLVMFDDDRARRLAELDVQLRELDGCDPADVGSIQQKIILTEQKRLTEQKLASDREALRLRVQRDALAAVEGIDFVGFIASVRESELEKATVAFTPFFETRARAEQAALLSDAVHFLAELRRSIADPRTNQPAAMLPRLRRFAAGGKLWGTGA